MVLAGSMKVSANAEEYARRLRVKGYSNTSIEKFNKVYFVVVVDRFDNLSDAKALVGKLKNDGIDSFVKKR